jgi:hypothetical protein
MKILLFFFLLIFFNKSYSQSNAFGAYKIDSNYKIRTKLNLVVEHFIRPELDKIEKEKENIIKLYAIHFSLDSNLKIETIFIKGALNENIKSSLKIAVLQSLDSLKKRKTNFNSLKGTSIYIPIFYINKVNPDKPAVAVLSEASINDIFNEPNACPPNSYSFFYMPTNLIILNPITFHNPPLEGNSQNWGKVKFIKKTSDDD